jgi:hypothetical protein
MIDDNGLPIVITDQKPKEAQKSCFNLKEQDLPRGKARILTKIAHSIVKPLLKWLHEAGKNKRNGDKCCMNYTKYT